MLAFLLNFADDHRQLFPILSRCWAFKGHTTSLDTEITTRSTTRRNRTDQCTSLCLRVWLTFISDFNSYVGAWLLLEWQLVSLCVSCCWVHLIQKEIFRTEWLLQIVFNIWTRTFRYCWRHFHHLSCKFCLFIINIIMEFGSSISFA